MKNVFKGLNDTFTLIAFRTANAPKILILLGLAFAGGALLTLIASLFFNDVIYALLTQPQASTPFTPMITEVQGFLREMLTMYAADDNHYMVLAIVLTLISPLILLGVTTQESLNMVPDAEASIVKKNDNYKIGDSILFQLLSSYSFLQLIVLSMVSKFLTFDSPNPNNVVIVMWGLWVVSGLIVVLASWFLEYLSRKLSAPWVKIALFVATAAAVTIAILIDENRGLTLFGGSDIIVAFLESVAGPENTMFFVSLGAVAGVILLLLLLIGFVASKTMTIPEVSIKEKKNKKLITRPYTPLTVFTLTSMMLFRYKPIFKTILTSIILSAIMVVLLKGELAMTTLVIIIPLSVTIAYGVNAFGIYTGAVKLISGIHGWQWKLMNTTLVITTLLTAVSYMLVVLVGVFSSSMTVGDVMLITPTLITMTLLTGYVSLLFSSYNPIRFYSRPRENLVSNPATLMIYLVVLVTLFVGLSNVSIALQGETLVWGLVGVLALGMMMHYPFLVDRVGRSSKLLLTLK